MGRRLTPPTLGGAGKQTPAGAINTSTHGGDVARPPIGDYVRAMIVVGSGDSVRLIQRPGDRVVDIDLLKANLRDPAVQLAVGVDAAGRSLADTLIDDDTVGAFEAALVAVGRLGVVYAYVFTVHDETTSWIFEERHTTTWTAVANNLLRAPGSGPNIVDAALAGDEFLQVVINPVPGLDGIHRCYVTSHKRLPQGAELTATPALAFGFDPATAMTLRSLPVDVARSPQLPPDIGQALCSTTTTPELSLLHAVLLGLGVWAAANTLGPVPLPLDLPEALAAEIAVEAAVDLVPFGRLVFFSLFAAACFDAAASVARIGPDHVLGDVVADVLNFAAQRGLSSLVGMLNSAILDNAQSDRTSDLPATHDHPHFPAQPWLVHGTRWDIADFFDYDSDCYRGDSIEIFFVADTSLPGKVNLLLTLINNLFQAGRPIAAYISLRFLSPSGSLPFEAGAHALLATTIPAVPVTCAIEISMLRGLEGNTDALNQIQALAANNEGRVHWGQWNTLDQPTVATMFGSDLDAWHTQLARLEGDSLLFRNRFTESHGLELPAPPNVWDGWVDAGITGASGAPDQTPAVVSAFASGDPIHVFVVDSGLQVSTSTRPVTGAPSPWHPIRSEAVDRLGSPTVHRNDDGRLEVFVRMNERLNHSWEQGHPGGAFADWDTLGRPAFLGPNDAPRIDTDPVVVTRGDGGLEAHAREADIARHRLLHSGRGAFDLWGGLSALGEEPVGGRITACQRHHVEGVATFTSAVVVATDPSGTVIWKAQGPGGGDWNNWQAAHAPGELPQVALGGGSPLVVEVQGASVGGRPHIFIIDSSGQVLEAVADNATTAITWQPWQALPAVPSDRLLSESRRLAAVQSTHLWLFALSRRGRLMAIEWAPGGGWGGWVELGGDIAGHVSAGVHGDGTIEVFAFNATTNHLMARRQVAPNRWS
jgi:hypothetical protein